MDIGMLWYDDDRQRQLAEKVARAADHYRKKYGAPPTICFVHPSLLPNGPEIAAGIALRPAQTVMVNHFWLGISDAVERARKPN